MLESLLFCFKSSAFPVARSRIARRLFPSDFPEPPSQINSTFSRPSGLPGVRKRRRRRVSSLGKDANRRLVAFSEDESPLSWLPVPFGPGGRCFSNLWFDALPHDGCTYTDELARPCDPSVYVCNTPPYVPYSSLKRSYVLHLYRRLNDDSVADVTS